VKVNNECAKSRAALQTAVSVPFHPPWRHAKATPVPFRNVNEISSSGSIFIGRRTGGLLSYPHHYVAPSLSLLPQRETVVTAGLTHTPCPPGLLRQRRILLLNLSTQTTDRSSKLIHPLGPSTDSPNRGTSSIAIPQRSPPHQEILAAQRYRRSLRPRSN
jgi:hypothetical protein